MSILIIFLCRDYDGKVTPEEVASAAMYLKDTLGKEGIQELIGNLSKDRGARCCIVYYSSTCLLMFLVLHKQRGSWFYATLRMRAWEPVV